MRLPGLKPRGDDPMRSHYNRAAGRSPMRLAELSDGVFSIAMTRLGQCRRNEERTRLAKLLKYRNRDLVGENVWC